MNGLQAIIPTMPQTIAISRRNLPCDPRVGLRRRLLLAFGMLLALATPLSACPLCMGSSPRQPTMAEQMIQAQEVVLARRSIHEGFDIQAVIKGDATLKGTSIQIADAVGDGVLVVTRTRPGAPWNSQGNFASYLQPFLRTVLAWPLGQPPSDADWTARLLSVRPFIAHTDPRIASSAWAIWAQAPRLVIKQQAATISGEDLRLWLDDRSRIQQHGLWLTLLGFRGNSEDAHWIEQRMQTASDNHDDLNLAALLSAFIEQQGESAIELIEQRYILERGRTMGELRAALSALSLQGRENSPKIRARVIHSFRDFVEGRPDLAGFVGRDLAAWEQWDLVPKFNELKISKSVHSGAVLGIAEFLSAWERKSP